MTGAERIINYTSFLYFLCIVDLVPICAMYVVTIVTSRYLVCADFICHSLSSELYKKFSYAVYFFIIITTKVTQKFPVKALNTFQFSVFIKT